MQPQSLISSETQKSPPQKCPVLCPDQIWGPHVIYMYLRKQEKATEPVQMRCQ